MVDALLATPPLGRTALGAGATGALSAAPPLGHTALGAGAAGASLAAPPLSHPALGAGAADVSLSAPPLGHTALDAGAAGALPATPPFSYPASGAGAAGALSTAPPLGHSALSAGAAEEFFISLAEQQQQQPQQRPLQQQLQQQQPRQQQQQQPSRPQQQPWLPPQLRLGGSISPWSPAQPSVNSTSSPAVFASLATPHSAESSTPSRLFTPPGFNTPPPPPPKVGPTSLFVSRFQHALPRPDHPLPSTTGKPLPAVAPRGGPDGIVCAQGGAPGDPYPGDSAAGRDTLCNNAGASFSTTTSANLPSLSDSGVSDPTSDSAKYGEPGAAIAVSPDTMMPPKILCLPPAMVESLLGGNAETLASESCAFRLTTMDPHDSTIRAAVSEVMRKSQAVHSGYQALPTLALMALELGRRTHGRLDAEQASLLLRPHGRFVPSSLGLTTRLTLSPLALDFLLGTAFMAVDPALEFSKLQLDPADPSTQEAMLRIVDAARLQFPNSVLSAPTVYYALMYSRTTNPESRLDLSHAFDALQVLSFIDAPPGVNDWDLSSLNSRDAPLLPAAPAENAPLSPRRRITPTLVSGGLSDTSSIAPLPNDSPSSSTLSARGVNVKTPTLPPSWLQSSSPTGDRRVSFQDLGYRYRVGSKRPLDASILSAPDLSTAPSPGSGSAADSSWDANDEDGGFEGADDIGDEDSDASYDDDDDVSDGSDGSASTKASTVSHKKKSARRSTAAQTLGLIRTLIAKMSSTSMLAKPPELWFLGEPPKGGYFLETFTRLYGLYKAFTNISGEDCGLSFKNLVTEDIEPTVRSRLKLKSQADWDAISSSELIKALKANLGFKDKDYYLARLEEFQLPPNSASDDKIFSAFVQQTSQMLAIEAEGIRADVKLRRPTVKNIFNNYVRRHYRLNQWFHERTFKSLSRTINHISREFKKVHVQDKRKSHEKRQDAILNGARSDFRGGKVEPGGAADSHDAAKRRRGISKNPRGTSRGNHLSRGGPRGGGREGSAPRDTRTDRGSSRGGGGSKPSGRPDLREAYAAEDMMEKGRFWHEKGPFCKSENCRARVCQGCNYHSSADDPGHDRPHCPHSEHKDFVAAPKYFHAVWPGRKTALVPPGKTSTPGSPAKANHMTSRKDHASEE